MRHGLTQTECETEALFMFVAGSDTTAAVIRITMLHILSIPRVYQKLKEEITATIHEGKVSSPIKSSEAKTLPYLQVRPEDVLITYIKHELIINHSPGRYIRRDTSSSSGREFLGKGSTAWRRHHRRKVHTSRNIHWSQLVRSTTVQSYVW
jgi:hypothetical protein